MKDKVVIIFSRGRRSSLTSVDFHDARQSLSNWTSALQQQELTWQSLGDSGVTKTLPSMRSALDALGAGEERTVLVVGSAYASGMARFLLTSHPPLGKQE